MPAMARIAVISDVHANLEALQEVLRLVQGMELYCLGDLVGYGAEPNEVVDALRQRRAVCVLGNHDHAALTGDAAIFNARAAMSSRWTTTELTGSSIDYLRGLPKEVRLQVDGVGAYLTHGSPDDNLWEYVDPSTHNLLFDHYLGKLGVGLIGLGHTHVPYTWKQQRGVVFNPGSVGQPRDGDRRASYALVSVTGGRVEVENLRVEYDYQKAASKIRAAGLPEFFADRLYIGT